MHFFVVIVIPLCMLTTKTNKFGYKEFQARVAHNSAKSAKMPDFMCDRVYKNWIQDCRCSESITSSEMNHLNAPSARET